jgi:hypothetical protein
VAASIAAHPEAYSMLHTPELIRWTDFIPIYGTFTALSRRTAHAHRLRLAETAPQLTPEGEEMMAEREEAIQQAIAEGRLPEGAEEEAEKAPPELRVPEAQMPFMFGINKFLALNLPLMISLASTAAAGYLGYRYYQKWQEERWETA